MKQLQILFDESPMGIRTHSVDIRAHAVQRR